jgi:hypothetical protein
VSFLDVNLSEHVVCAASAAALGCAGAPWGISQRLRRLGANSG